MKTQTKKTIVLTRWETENIGTTPDVYTFEDHPDNDNFVSLKFGESSDEAIIHKDTIQDFCNVLLGFRK
jgi:hypothetical protein